MYIMHIFQYYILVRKLSKYLGFFNLMDEMFDLVFSYSCCIHGFRKILTELLQQKIKLGEICSKKTLIRSGMIRLD